MPKLSKPQPHSRIQRVHLLLRGFEGRQAERKAKREEYNATQRLEARKWRSTHA